MNKIILSNGAELKVPKVIAQDIFTTLEAYNLNKGNRLSNSLPPGNTAKFYKIKNVLYYIDIKDVQAIVVQDNEESIFGKAREWFKGALKSGGVSISNVSNSSIQINRK